LSSYFLSLAENIFKKIYLFDNIVKEEMKEEEMKEEEMKEEEMKEEEMQEMIYIIPRKNNISIQEEIIQQQDQFVKIVYEQIIGQQNQLETKLEMREQKIKNMRYKIRCKNEIIQKLECHILKQQKKIREMKEMIKLKKCSHAYHMDIKSNQTRKLKTKNGNEGFLKDLHTIDRLTIISNERQNIEFGLKSYDIENQLQEIILEFLKKEKLILDIRLKYKRQNNQEVSYNYNILNIYYNLFILYNFLYNSCINIHVLISNVISKFIYLGNIYYI
jgi:hypothetical protein